MHTSYREGRMRDEKNELERGRKRMWEEEGSEEVCANVQACIVWPSTLRVPVLSTH